MTDIGQQQKTCERIASLVKEHGGRAFYVGGFVRDRVMAELTGSGSETAKIPDIDIEVHGLKPDKLYEILGSIGEPLSFGSNFGIYSLKGSQIDVALPRRERSVGVGHRDFEVDVDPFIGTEAAARRRDFTMNAMMEDVLSGEIVDYFGGKKDIARGIIRHVDPSSFPEDPLRVLRAAQFAARLGFTVADETVELMRGIDISQLSMERIEGEMKKALLESERPSVFFKVLRDCGKLNPWFEEIEETIGVRQDPVYHPEGDVWKHTMEVLDRAEALRDQAEEPYGLMMLCLTHDLGKITTSEESADGRIHAYGHEDAGPAIAQKLLDRVVSRKDIKKYVLDMIPIHMKPNMVAYSHSKEKVTNRMFDQAASPLDLVLFAMADRPVMVGNENFYGDAEFLFERLRTYEEYMARPHVMGHDLIMAGIDPDEDFSEILAYAHKLRLAGIPKDQALKQTIRYAEQLRGQK
ncbi:MAG: HD domain-containing protein [Firmicutes bacterium]|nr:HD domain-containing protein [Bacillota bacterium]